jgi:hypothetical protein
MWKPETNIDFRTQKLWDNRHLGDPEGDSRKYSNEDFSISDIELLVLLLYSLLTYL